jgi:hypothetical protein
MDMDEHEEEEQEANVISDNVDNASVNSARPKGGRPAGILWNHFKATSPRDPTTRRCNAECLACGAPFKSARNEVLVAHLQITCNSLTGEARTAITAALAAKASEAVVPTGATREALKKRRTNDSKKLITGHFASSVPFTSAENHLHNLKLLRWIVNGGVPFNAMQSTFFLDWVDGISNHRYIPAGECTCSYSMYALVMIYI